MLKTFKSALLKVSVSVNKNIGYFP